MEGAHRGRTSAFGEHDARRFTRRLFNQAGKIMSAVRNAKLNQWVAVAQQLCRNAPHSASCPDCEQRTLVMQDREYGPPHNRGRERYLICTSCGAFNVVSVRRAGVQSRA